jgi:hypothetical protein
MTILFSRSTDGAELRSTVGVELRSIDGVQLEKRRGKAVRRAQKIDFINRVMES